MKPDIALSLAARVCAAIMIGVIAFLPIARSEAATPPTQRIAEAEDYPRKPIRIIEGFTIGGGSDAMARMIGEKLTERFGQQVVVDNRPGAGSNIGAKIAATAPPDGYTLFAGLALALGSSVSLYPQRGYDVMKDFAFITLTAAGTYVMVVTPSVPARSVAALVVLAKSRPGQLNYGSSGVGSAGHLSGELLKSRAGVDILHVPYKTGESMLGAVAGGEVQVSYPSIAVSTPLIKAGRITALAVTSLKRAKALPDLPTIAESGFPGYDVTAFYGLLAPAATPSAIVKSLNVEIRKILQLPDVQGKAAPFGLEATASTPEDFKEIMRAEIEKWAKVIKEAGIKPE